MTRFWHQRQQTGPGQLEYAPRKRGRVVDCTGLENRRRETVREFESHRFRHFTNGKFN